MVLMSLFGGQGYRCTPRGQTWALSRGRSRRDEVSGLHWNKYITICKTDSEWKAAVWHRKLNPVLWVNLEGWEGVGGSFQREGTQVYTSDWFTVVVWQKPTQHCREMTLQFKKNTTVSTSVRMRAGEVRIRCSAQRWVLSAHLSTSRQCFYLSHLSTDFSGRK